VIDEIQDAELAKEDLAEHERLVQLRSPWEELYREIDARFPNGAGGFTATSPGQIRGARNYDGTHVTANSRFAAAGVAITTPEENDYIRPFFLDEDLNKERSVQLWRADTGRRLKAIRHAAHTGFIIAANEDWDQLGRYGTSAVWQEATPRGIFYKCLHLSQIYIDTDFAGLVNTVHRKFCLSARKAEQQFGREALTPKMIEALEQPGKRDQEFEILHVVAPNTDYDAESFDHRRFPVVSRYMAVGEKLYLRRKGYYTMPISVSRHMTSAGEIYGRSPAIDMAPNINGVNAMKLTTLRSAHKATDPALLFNDDDGVTKLVSKPGGMNPGMVDDMGRAKVVRMPGGEAGIPFALDMIAAEQNTVRVAFLEEFYKILTDPNSRMTTTEVLEVMAKQGVLVRPFASRYAMEKQHPQTQRDMDLALRARQIKPLPPEVQEAGAWPLIGYENPLAAMARAESSAKSLRFLQALPILRDLDPAAADRVNVDEMTKGLAEEMGVRPDYMRGDKEVAALKRARDEERAAAVDAELLGTAAGAAKDLAQANSLAGIA
jgi:hypothetical protein